MFGIFQQLPEHCSYRVNVLRAANETHRTHARPVASERGDGSFDYFWVALKPVAVELELWDPT